MIFQNVDISHLNFKELTYTLQNQNDDWPEGLAPLEGRAPAQYFMYQPKDWNTQPEYKKFMDSLFHPYNDSFINKQEPGQHYVPHTDRHERTRKKFGVGLKDVCRIMVFLEDWQTGHYFEIDNTPIVNWKAGDLCVVPAGVMHLSMNGGLTPKYTWQINGLVSELQISIPSL